MAEAITERNLTCLTQVQAAALVGVDRTTIRAWTEEGMPYDPPVKRGQVGSYRATVLVHWQMLIDLRKHPAVALRMPKNMTPPQAIAFVHVNLCEDTWEGDIVYAAQMRKILEGYYHHNIIEQAIGFGLAFREIGAAMRKARAA